MKGSTWTVTVKGAKRKQHIAVYAQYFNVKEGVLCFRNYRDGNYPLTVRAFAPGYWLDLRLDDKH